MKIISKFPLIAITLLLLTIVGCEDAEKYQVEILQDGKVVPIVDQVASLEKKEFKIRVTLIDHDGVFISASFNRDYFDLRDDQEIKDYKDLSSKTRAEENFNKDKLMFVHDEFVSYLFYDKKMDWHRFDKDIIIKGNKVIGTKTVQKIFDEGSDQEIPIDQIEKTIYLFFLATEEWTGGEGPKELGRKKIELRWK